ncbi:SGNH/GDSL hydrolase family protein [Undibacterium sp. TJN19]|uniref:SGNH/GDSL hydrolase family protein n=1 Tax=Undibacterium sp. TJN19 TaxID=3413055 RepID=UPI003BEF7D96
MELTENGIVISTGNIDKGANKDKYPGGVDDNTFAKRILCEGDSWFSIGALPSSNLLFPLRFAQTTLLYNLATPGDTIRNMSDISSNPELSKLINNQTFSTKWDAIFISGGGNDLIDKVSQILCRPSAGAGGHLLDYVNGFELAKLKVDLQKNYKKIADLRANSKNRDTPIVTHVYDYPTPRDAKAKFLGFGFVGPWLYNAMKSADIPEQNWISLADYIFEWLGSVLIDLSSKIDNFHVISNTRETLTRARLGTTGDDGDWLNEIHPNATGYKKLADVISPELQALL